MTPSISAALIVRDEERHVEACLRSLVDAVDEIVVVDTGSVDRTREIASAFPVRLAEVPWRGDFARARNAALERARGDWILSIDADERLRAAGDLRRQLDEPSAVAGAVRFRVRRGFTPYHELRLFRNRPDLRFRGAIHETVLPDVGRLIDAGGSIVETSAAIDHLGYDGDRSRKHARDLPLLERAVRSDPDRLYLWHALGVARAGLGDPAGAERAWKNGLDRLLRSDRSSAIGLLLLADLSDLRLDRGDSAADLVAEATARFPAHPLATWLAARQAVFDDRPDDALPLLARLLDLGADDLVDPTLAMDERIFGELAWAMLGTCRLRLGEPDRAADAFRRAERAAPGVAEYRVKRRLAEARARGRSRSPDRLGA